MASGADVLIPGGTTMKQVVAGTDTILSQDFNNMRLNVQALLGPAANIPLGSVATSALQARLLTAFGYGQGGSSVGASSSDGIIYADNAIGGFKRLQDDIQTLADFLDITLRAGSGTDVTSSNTITAAAWNDTILDIKNIYENRFVVPGTSLTTSTAASTETGYPILDSSVTGHLDMIVTFVDQHACRAFFNAGGKIGVSASYINVTSADHEIAFKALLAASGDIFLGHENFYNLSTTESQVFLGHPPSQYSIHSWQVVANIDSITNPTIIIIRSRWHHATLSGISQAELYGTMTYNARLQQPTGGTSGITVAAPSMLLGSFGTGSGTQL